MYTPRPSPYPKARPREGVATQKRRGAGLEAGEGPAGGHAVLGRERLVLLDLKALGDASEVLVVREVHLLGERELRLVGVHELHIAADGRALGRRRLLPASAPAWPSCS